MLVAGNVRYRETTPGPVFRSYSRGLDLSNDSTLRNLRQAGHVRPNANVTWANYRTTSVSITRNLSERNVSLTRGRSWRAPGWATSVNFGNRASSPTPWTGSVTVGATEDGGRTRRASTTVSIRPGPRWQMSGNRFYERLTETRQTRDGHASGSDPKPPKP